MVIPEEVLGFIPGVGVCRALRFWFAFKESWKEQLGGDSAHWCLDQDQEHGYNQHLQCEGVGERNLNYSAMC